MKRCLLCAALLCVVGAMAPNHARGQCPPGYRCVPESAFAGSQQSFPAFGGLPTAPTVSEATIPAAQFGGYGGQFAAPGGYGYGGFPSTFGGFAPPSPYGYGVAPSPFSASPYGSGGCTGGLAGGYSSGGGSYGYRPTIRFEFLIRR
jgi:hypothetical protein